MTRAAWRDWRQKISGPGMIRRPPVLHTPVSGSRLTPRLFEQILWRTEATRAAWYPKESRLIQEAVDQVRRRAIRRRSEGSAVSPVAGTRFERFYLPQLDGLRFVAFFAVFVCHFPISSKWSLVPWVSAIADAGA
jgi:hypothetical protein